MRLKATFKRVRGMMREYETCEGLLLNVLTLPPEEMVRKSPPTWSGGGSGTFTTSSC